LYNYAYPERKPLSTNTEINIEPKGEINDGEIKEEQLVEKIQIEEIKSIEENNNLSSNGKIENADNTSTNNIKI